MNVLGFTDTRQRPAKPNFLNVINLEHNEFEKNFLSYNLA